MKTIVKLTEHEVFEFKKDNKPDFIVDMHMDFIEKTRDEFGNDINTWITIFNTTRKFTIDELDYYGIEELYNKDKLYKIKDSDEEKYGCRPYYQYIKYSYIYDENDEDYYEVLDISGQNINKKQK